MRRVLLALLATALMACAHTPSSVEVAALIRDETRPEFEELARSANAVRLDPTSQKSAFAGKTLLDVGRIKEIIVGGIWPQTKRRGARPKNQDILSAIRHDYLTPSPKGLGDPLNPPDERVIRIIYTDGGRADMIFRGGKPAFVFIRVAPLRDDVYSIAKRKT